MKVLDWCLYLQLIANLLACQTLQPATPKQTPLSAVWDGRIYLGDSHRLGVAQSLVSPVVGCADPSFDRMVCMSVEDYTALMQYFLQAACVNQ